MLEWVEAIVKPYAANAPRRIAPIHLLLSFKVQQQGFVVNTIQAIVIEVEFIPPCPACGCGLQQALQVQSKSEFHHWLILQDPDKPTPNLTCCNVTGWIIKAKCNIHKKMIHNTWKKMNFLYFPNQPQGISSAGAGGVNSYSMLTMQNNTKLLIVSQQRNRIIIILLMAW